MQLKTADRVVALPDTFAGATLLARDEPKPLADARASLRNALTRPDGGPTLEAFLEGKERVVLVLPDATRPVPKKLVRELLEHLGPKVAVRIANGTHRRSTREERKELLGAWEDAVEHGDRSADEPAAHTALAKGSIDKVAAEADGLVLFGPVSFHYLAGFGGGGKLVAPGLADRATAEWIHSACLGEKGRHPRARAGVLDGNPLRERLEQVCVAAPPQLHVVTVLDSAGRPIEVRAGERDKAFRAACATLQRDYTLPCRRHRVVIACGGGAPTDLDFVQGHKALDTAAAACEEGGTIVLVASMKEGLPARHRAFLEQHPDAAAMETALRAKFDIAAHTVWAARAKAERFDVRVVSDMDAALVAKLGMKPAPDLAAALEGLDPSDAAVLPFGARFLPVPK
jgi:nickel-dependent lactate racemase